MGVGLQQNVGRLTMRHLHVDDVVMVMVHVRDCCCRYVASPLDTNDVKLIDVRCIQSYAVPEVD